MSDEISLIMIYQINIYFSALLRAHISLIIDNREFHDALKDTTSDEFQSIAKPLCNEARIFQNTIIKCEN